MSFGLYDMLGNVWEWVNDWYDQNYYQNSPSQDPTGQRAGSPAFCARVLGSFACRTASGAILATGAAALGSVVAGKCSFLDPFREDICVGQRTRETVPGTVFTPADWCLSRRHGLSRTHIADSTFCCAMPTHERVNNPVELPSITASTHQQARLSPLVAQALLPVLSGHKPGVALSSSGPMHHYQQSFANTATTRSQYHFQKQPHLPTSSWGDYGNAWLRGSDCGLFFVRIQYQRHITMGELDIEQDSSPLLKSHSLSCSLENATSLGL